MMQILLGVILLFKFDKQPWIQNAIYFLKNCLNGIKGCDGIFNKVFKEISNIKVQIHNKDTCLTFAFCKLII